MVENISVGVALIVSYHWNFCILFFKLSTHLIKVVTWSGFEIVVWQVFRFMEKDLLILNL